MRKARFRKIFRLHLWRRPVKRGAHESWKDAVADEIVVKAPRYDLGNQGKAAFLDPNLITPSGTERECLARHQERLQTDPHFAPDPVLSERPRTIDTGGDG